MTGNREKGSTSARLRSVLSNAVDNFSTTGSEVLSIARDAAHDFRTEASSAVGRLTSELENERLRVLEDYRRLHTRRAVEQGYSRRVAVAIGEYMMKNNPLYKPTLSTPDSGGPSGQGPDSGAPR